MISKVLLGHPNEAGPYQDGYCSLVLKFKHNIVNGQLISLYIAFADFNKSRAIFFEDLSLVGYSNLYIYLYHCSVCNTLILKRLGPDNIR